MYTHRRPVPLNSIGVGQLCLSKKGLDLGTEVGDRADLAGHDQATDRQRRLPQSQVENTLRAWQQAQPRVGGGGYFSLTSEAGSSMIADGGRAVNAAATGRHSRAEFLHPFQADPRPEFRQRRQRL
jgi:hypothetical protein